MSDMNEKMSIIREKTSIIGQKMSIIVNAEADVYTRKDGAKNGMRVTRRQ